MNLKFLKNTGYLYLLTIVKIIFPLITLPYLTRVLSVSTYGLVAYVKAYNSYVQLLIDFGFLLSATKLIAVAKEDKQLISKITGDTYAEKIFLVIVAIVVTIVATNVIPLLEQNKLFVWLYFLSVILTILVPDFLYRGIEKMEYAALPFVCSKVVVLISTFIFVKSDVDLLLIPILEILGNFVAGCVSLTFLKKLDIRIAFSNLDKWIADIKESGVYFFSNFATTFFGAMTTIIVGIVMDAKEIAYWSLCMQIVAAAKSMYTPITNSLYPHMMLSRDLRIVKKIGLLFSIPLSLGSVLVLFWGKPIMEMIGGQEYGYAGWIMKFLLPVLVVSFYSMLYGWPVLGCIGKVKETTITTVCAALVQVIGIIILIVINQLTLITLALCCCVSEFLLLILRLVIFSHNKASFNIE